MLDTHIMCFIDQKLFIFTLIANFPNSNNYYDLFISAINHLTNQIITIQAKVLHLDIHRPLIEYCNTEQLLNNLI